ncbi:HNH endonuclease [Staphylococcus pseudintermedius]|nr:HNH endonuclease [Staphylococcus pseudintermedius]
MKNLKLYQLEDMIEVGAIKQFDKSEKNIYYISKFGNIYSQSKSNPEIIKMMSLVPDGEGYLRTHINGKTVKAHILVAESFIRPRKSKEVINHLDGNRKNNTLENLEVTTQSNNLKHFWSMKKERRRLTPEKAEQIRMLHFVEGLSYNAIARQFDCTATSVRQIINNITFKK